jgi:hypothetical protein
MARMDGEERAKPQNGRRSAKENWCKLRCLWNWGKKVNEKETHCHFYNTFWGRKNETSSFLVCDFFHFCSLMVTVH